LGASRVVSGVEVCDNTPARVTHTRRHTYERKRTRARVHARHTRASTQCAPHAACPCPFLRFCTGAAHACTRDTHAQARSARRVRHALSRASARVPLTRAASTAAAPAAATPARPRDPPAASAPAAPATHAPDRRIPRPPPEGVPPSLRLLASNENGRKANPPKTKAQRSASSTA
jgi:hypothetical protein